MNYQKFFYKTREPDAASGLKPGAAVYWGLPVLIFLLPYFWKVTNIDEDVLYAENGIIELGTAVFLFVGIYYAFRALRLSGGCRILFYWIILLLLGSIYFAGEELSWGQHLFGWETHETWKAVNDQGETNIHNVSAVFDQWPRFLLTMAVLFGGLLIPLYNYLRGIELYRDRLAYWFLPTPVCVPASLFIVVIKLVDIVANTFSVFLQLDVSSGELKECLLAVFIMLYLISLKSRLSVFHPPQA